MSDAVETANASPALPPITSSLIIQEAVALFEGTLGRTAHVWLIILVLNIVERLAPLIPLPYHGAWVPIALLSEAYAQGAATRGLLRDRMGLWVPNRDFGLYLGTSLLLILPTAGAVAIVGLLFRSFTLGLLLAVPVAVLMLQYYLWPIGLLIGYDKMTAAESARLMNGRITSLIGALLQVFLVLAIPFALFLFAAFDLGGSTAWTYAEQVVRAIFYAGRGIAATAILAAMYKLTADRAEVPSGTTPAR